MSCGRRRGWIRVVIAMVIAMMLAGPARAQTLRVVGRFTPEAGDIVDAAVLPGGHLMLLYPEAARIADYSFDGQLNQHIIRESGEESRFRPLACTVNPDGRLLVFDEAAHKVFFIGADGNITKGVDLAYPAEGGALALSRVGDLAAGAGQVIWATLPERGVLAAFDYDGNHVVSLELAAMLPYQPALYTRGQVLSDGSIYVLEYHQGAVLYRRGAQGAYHRLRLSEPQDGVVVPALQDFAVDDSGNVLLVTHSDSTPLQLLTPGPNGYQAHPVNLDLPSGRRRLACRWSGGMFILWTRDEPEVTVLQLLP
jgi:hypothetical protein